MKKKGWKKMDEARFTLIKTLINSGAKPGVIVKAVGASYEAIARIKKCDSLEDYQKSLRAYYDKYWHPKTTVITPKSDDTLPADQVVTLLKENNRLLTALINEIKDSKGNRPFKNYFSKWFD